MLFFLAVIVSSALPSFGVMSDWMNFLVASISSGVKIFFYDDFLQCREKMYNFATDTASAKGAAEIKYKIFSYPHHLRQIVRVFN